MTSEPSVPVLHPGDKLTRSEFLRRYEAMPELKKAELIEGVVYVGSPVSLSRHGQPHVVLSYWIGHYLRRTPGLLFGDNSTVVLDEDNVPQPDLLLAIPRAAGGRARVSALGYLDGPPDLAIEVAASSVSYDMHQKLDTYRRSGVREYLVYRVEDRAVDWFELVDGRYVALASDAGVLKSGVFSGLWLDVTAVLRSDLGALAAGIDRGTGEAAHAAFAARVAPRSDGGTVTE